MSPVRREVSVLVRLALPVVGAQVAMMAMGLVDTLMVARIGVPELAASALANTWAWAFTSFAMGIVLGMDPLVSQAHGRGDGAGVALAYQRGLIVGLLVSPLVVLAFVLTGPGLLWLGQDPEISELANRYMWIRAWSQPFFFVYLALRQYLQGRALMRPAMWVMFYANFLNAALNYVLIFGKFGFPRMELEGAALASAIMTVVLPFALFGWVRVFDLRSGARRAWDRVSFEARGLGQVLRLGIPVGFQMGVEAWAFSLAVVLAGWLGTAEVASHNVALNMVALAFMVPLGISIGVATRVGNLIGQGDGAGMRRAAWVAIGLTATSMLFFVFVFLAFRWQLPRLYTPERSVVELVAYVLPIAATFQLFDGTQVVAAGVLRGMGRNRAAAWIYLVGYFLFGLPLAYVLAFNYGGGLPGIWWGLALAIGAVSLLMLAWVWRTSQRPIDELRVLAA